jgi:UDP:flavonoid glycosyltransferase YjiC (YdhE family)
MFDVVRCLVAALGSRGDVEPFVLVAEALAARGHHVSLALDDGHHAGARAVTGIERVALGRLGADDLSAIVADAIAQPTPNERSLRAQEAFFGSRAGALQARVEELAGSGFDLALLAEQLLFPRHDPPGLRWPVPTAVAIHVPSPRRDFVALGPVPCLRLAALSPLFAPRDDRELSASWTFTGFWLRRTPGRLDDRLARFLEAGPPPVFLTMGSMRGFAPGLADRLVTAARRAGLRAVVQRGWADLDVAPAPDVLVVGETDYAALFRRCAALFIHGGTGTVGHALRAGRPIAVLPLVNDQLIWARSLQQMGNGLGDADPQTATTDDLERLLRRALEDPGPARAAAAIAARLRDEDGLTAACHALERGVPPT